MNYHKLILLSFSIFFTFLTACSPNISEDSDSIPSSSMTDETQATTTAEGTTTAAVTTKATSIVTTTTEEPVPAPEPVPETTQPPSSTTVPQSSAVETAPETADTSLVESTTPQVTAPAPTTFPPRETPIEDFGHQDIYEQYQGQDIMILEAWGKVTMDNPQIVITDPDVIQTIHGYLDGIVLSSYYGHPRTGGSSYDGLICIEIYFMKDGIEQGYSLLFYSSDGDSSKNAAKYLNELDYFVWYEIDPAAFDYLKTFFDYQMIE